MKKQKRLFVLQTVTLVAYGVMAASVFLLSSDPFSDQNKARGIGVGIMFWSGLLIGVGSQVLLWLRLRHLIRGRIGLLCFFRNRYGAIADIVLALSLIGVILILIFQTKAELLEMIIWALFIYSFPTHCVLNGRKFNYIYHIHRQQIKRSVYNEGSA